MVIALKLLCWCAEPLNGLKGLSLSGNNLDSWSGEIYGFHCIYWFRFNLIQLFSFKGFLFFLFKGGLVIHSQISS